MKESQNGVFLERLLAILLSRWFLAALAAILLMLVSLELASLIDEAIWEYAAWLWAVHGDPPYVGCFENKPVGIFLLYRACYAIFGLSLWPGRILGAAAIVGTLLLVYSIAQGYRGRIAGAMAALIFAFAMTSHTTDGYMLAVTESFMIFFTATAFYLLSSVYWQRRVHPERSVGCWPLLGIGAAFGAALGFKQIALVDVLGLIPMYCVATQPNLSPRRLLRDVLLMLLGGGCVTVLSLVPLLIAGVTLQDYWSGAWSILFYQTGALPMGQRLKLVASTWSNPAVAVYYPFLLLFLFQKSRLQKSGIPFWSLLFWLCVTFVGANASNVYRHHLKEVMLPFSLIAGIGIGSAVESLGRWFTPRWLLWLYLSIIAALAPLDSVLIGVGRRTTSDVASCPDVLRDQTHRHLARYIRTHTTSSECIYIWAIYSHPIHLYAERRSSTRYFNAVFRFAPDFEATIAKELAARPPRLILIQAPVGDLPKPPSCVVQLLAKDYTAACHIGDFQIYERSGSDSKYSPCSEHTCFPDADSLSSAKTRGPATVTQRENR